MKKPFYSKHNRKFCVARTLANSPKLTKSDYLKAIFTKLGLNNQVWPSLLTRYKNMFTLFDIKNAHNLIMNLDDYLVPWPHFNLLCEDLYNITHSKAFRDYCRDYFHVNLDGVVATGDGGNSYVNDVPIC